MQIDRRNVQRARVAERIDETRVFTPLPNRIDVSVFGLAVFSQAAINPEVGTHVTL